MMKRLAGLFFLFFVTISCNISKSNNGGLYVRVKFDRILKNDTLELMLVDPFFGLHNIDTNSLKTSVKHKNGYFQFYLKPENDGYFQVLLLNNRKNIFSDNSTPQPLTPKFYFEVGDKLEIDITPKRVSGIDSLLFHYYKWYGYSFSGIGSNKLRASVRIDSVKRVIGDKPSNTIFNKDMQFLDRNEQSTLAAFNYLSNSKIRAKLSSEAYWVLQADNVYSNSRSKFAFIQYYLQELLGLKKTGYLYEVPDGVKIPDWFKNNYNASIDTAFNHYNIPRNALSQSDEYLLYLYYKVQVDCLVNFGIQDPDSIVDNIISSYFGKIRDRLLTYFLINNPYVSKNFDKNLTKAMSIVKTPGCLKALKFVEKRSSGNVAPDFTLPDENGDSVRLSDFKGKIVFIDFWYAGCGACADFYRTVLNKVEAKYKDISDVKFISINIDNKKRWMENLHNGLYTSNSAINLNTNGQDYHSNILKDYGIVIYPSYAIIKNGKTICFNIPEFRDSPDFLIRYIDSLRSADIKR